MAERVLVVEDEPDVLDALVQLLAHAGYEARGEADGLAGLRAFQAALGAEPFDLVMLDVMMPKIDGFTLCEAIRSSSDVPVMVLTALDGEDDQLRAFSLLADDFVPKPFSLPVVLERVRALLRRSAPGRGGAAGVVAWRDVVLDSASREAVRAGAPVGLTRTEFDVLLALMARPGRVLSRAELASAGGQADPADPTAGESAVKLHVMNIRRKLGADVVETMRGWATVCRAIASSLSAKVFLLTAALLAVGCLALYVAVAFALPGGYRALSAARAEEAAAALAAELSGADAGEAAGIVETAPLGLAGAIAALNAEAAAANEEIDSINASVRDRDALRGRLLGLADQIAWLDAKDEIAALDSAKAELSAAKEKLDEIDGRRRKLNADLNRERTRMAMTNIAAETINSFLANVYFDTGRFVLVPEGNVYKIRSRGKPVRPQDVSAGERNVLALCYFFSESGRGRFEGSEDADP